MVLREVMTLAATSCQIAVRIGASLIPGLSLLRLCRSMCLRANVRAEGGNPSGQLERLRDGEPRSSQPHRVRCGDGTCRYRWLESSLLPCAAAVQRVATAGWNLVCNHALLLPDHSICQLWAPFLLCVRSAPEASSSTRDARSTQACC